MSASKTYLLKSMVLARGLAELTVLVILSLLPIFLLLVKQFLVLHLILRIGILLLCPLSILGIWGLGQIPYKLVLDETGLNAIGLFKKLRLDWAQMNQLKQGSKIGFRQYVISHSGGELSFPCLFSKNDELLEQIRSRLPNRGRSIAGDAQSYKLPQLAFGVEIGKLVLQAGFAVIFFWFYFSLLKAGKSSQEDLLIVLGAAIAFSLAVLWKFVQTFRLPHEVKVTAEGLILSGPFKKQRTVAWNEIDGMEPVSLLFPDGKCLKLKKQTLLIGSGLDGFDELCEEISRRKLSK